MELEHGLVDEHLIISFPNNKVPQENFPVTRVGVFDASSLMSASISSTISRKNDLPKYSVFGTLRSEGYRDPPRSPRTVETPIGSWKSPLRR